MTDPSSEPIPLPMFRRLLQLDGTPESIALGTAIGLFVAMTPTVGIQMVIILLISMVIPVNRLAGLIMVYISNPLTMVPIYWLDYWVGMKCLAREGKSFAQFELYWNQLTDQATENAEGWYEVSLELLRSIGNDVLGPLFLGGSVVGLLCALPCYPLMLRLVLAYRSKKILEDLQRSPSKESGE
ncbi:MAG: DUF2062 domain-containing protein [Planctomycetota bacterium]|nr:DUF2062 domain-containing protein [Planctomycetota bacterium]